MTTTNGAERTSTRTNERERDDTTLRSRVHAFASVFVSKTADRVKTRRRYCSAKILGFRTLSTLSDLLSRPGARFQNRQGKFNSHARAFEYSDRDSGGRVLFLFCVRCVTLFGHTRVQTDELDAYRGSRVCTRCCTVPGGH